MTRSSSISSQPEGLDRLLENHRWELHGKVLSISGWL